eukprot:scaffold845_cov231-Pinguiococcus_pyrenoidosus.AAC.1
MVASLRGFGDKRAETAGSPSCRTEAQCFWCAVHCLQLRGVLGLLASCLAWRGYCMPRAKIQ